MAPIDDYVNDPDQALIDAITDPNIREYIEPQEIVTLTISMPDGTQAQIQALSRASIKAVLGRILQKGRAAQVRIRDLICSPDEFNLCEKLQTPTGELLRQLDSFLKSKWTQGGMGAAGVVTIFAFTPIGNAISIFAALGLINNFFIELCDCRS